MLYLTSKGRDRREGWEYGMVGGTHMRASMLKKEITCKEDALCCCVCAWHEEKCNRNAWLAMVPSHSSFTQSIGETNGKCINAEKRNCGGSAGLSAKKIKIIYKLAVFFLITRLTYYSWITGLHMIDLNFKSNCQSKWIFVCFGIFWVFWVRIRFRYLL